MRLFDIGIISVKVFSWEFNMIELEMASVGYADESGETFQLDLIDDNSWQFYKPFGV